MAATLLPRLVVLLGTVVVAEAQLNSLHPVAGDFVLRANISQPGDRLVANYLRPTLGQAGGGHIAPLAAFHAPSDRVLILDVARYRYPSVWVPVADLWAAIRTLDSTSGRSRGLVTIQRTAGT